MTALETGLAIACVFLFAVLWIVLVRANRIIARRNGVIVTLQGELAEARAKAAPFLARNRGERGRFIKRAA